MPFMLVHIKETVVSINANADSTRNIDNLKASKKATWLIDLLIKTLLRDVKSDNKKASYTYFLDSAYIRANIAKYDLPQIKNLVSSSAEAYTTGDFDKSKALVDEVIEIIDSLHNLLSPPKSVTRDTKRISQVAESATHINNRDTNKQIFSGLKSQGKMSSEEYEELCRLAEADAVGDIVRSRARGDAARNVVETLHSLALKGIVSGQETLGRNR
jgi:hypothetical protein